MENVKTSFLEEVFEHMMSISKGKCTIEESMIEEQSCEMERKILFGLLYMFEDLELYKSQFERAKESEYKIKLLEEKNREMAQFNYVASHDLQEPLRTVISFSDLLIDKYSGTLDEEADTYLGFIKSSSIRMQNLINGLLLYSKIGADRKLVSIDCNQTIENIKSDFISTLTEVNGTIQSQNLPLIKGYKIEFRQLLQNLVSNGLKFGRSNLAPVVSIDYTESNTNWTFSVSDNGLGIRKDHFERIFGIFQRLHNKETYKGTGIGLATCLKIVEMHGGKIWLQSAIDKGSTFYFTIPKMIEQ